MLKGLKKTSAGSFPGKIVVNIILMAFSITCIFPVIWLFYSSMKTKSEFYSNPISLPSSLNFDSYIKDRKSVV